MLDNDLTLIAKIQEKYPGVIEQIQDKAIEEDLQNATSSEYSKILKSLQSKVLGQEMATQVVASAITSQNKGNRGNFNFLFVGPTGIGKTELAKTIAVTKNNFISFKMNQYPGEADSTRFFGAAIGNVGSDCKPDIALELDRCQPIQIGFLEDKEIYVIENIVILFDELEKAHTKTRQSLLTLFDEGAIDISYTDWGMFKTSKNIKIQYQLRKSVIIATSNLFQQEICNAFQMNKNSEEIGEDFSMLNSMFFSQENYSPEFLGRLKIVPFGPIPKGIAYQSILKIKTNQFLKEFLEETNCKAIVVREEQENLFYQNLENILYGNGSNLRKILRFFDDIKRIINQNSALIGNISNKKLTLYSDNGNIFVKISMFSYGSYKDINSPPILIR